MISDKGKALRSLISEFSEEWWCAGWMEDIEYLVWYLGDAEPINNKMDQAKRIVDLGKEWGIWVRWNDELEFMKGYCVEEIPMDKWLKLYEDYQRVYKRYFGRKA